MKISQINSNAGPIGLMTELALFIATSIIFVMYNYNIELNITIIEWIIISCVFGCVCLPVIFGLTYVLFNAETTANNIADNTLHVAGIVQDANSMIIKVANWLFRLVCWPSHLLMAGYHDHDEGTVLVATSLAAGIALPIIGPYLSREVITSLSWQASTIAGAITYLTIGYLANALAKSFDGTGFLSK